jgi:hypothetical protein
MTKEQYLLIIQQPEVPMALWFEYYLERGGLIKDFHDFEKMFVTFTWHQAIVTGTDGNSKKINLGTALRNLHEYYAKKFDLW